MLAIKAINSCILNHIFDRASVLSYGRDPALHRHKVKE